MWGAVPCTALPTADENAVTESAVTTVSSSLFQPATVLTKNELSLAVRNLQATRVSNFLSVLMGLSELQSLKVVRRIPLPFLSAGVRKLSGAWLGCGSSQSCRGLSADAASYIPAVVAGSAPGACVSHILSHSSCSLS